MTLWTGTAPTFAGGDNATVVANLNTLRDAVKATSEAWTAYTPTWTAASANPAIGNGNFTGSAYMRVNKLIIFRAIITMGSTTTYGTGAWSLTLPVAPINAGHPSFVADFLDTGTAIYSGRLVISAGSITAALLTGAQPNLAVSATAPHTWANTDQLTVTGSYEAA